MTSLPSGSSLIQQSIGLTAVRITCRFLVLGRSVPCAEPNAQTKYGTFEMKKSKSKKQAIVADLLPGDPTCRSLVAHEADDKEIAKIFKENPSTLWVVTPTRIIARI